jgi:hypothetical protein
MEVTAQFRAFNIFTSRGAEFMHKFHLQVDYSRWCGCSSKKKKKANRHFKLELWGSDSAAVEDSCLLRQDPVLIGLMVS